MPLPFTFGTRRRQCCKALMGIVWLPYGEVSTLHRHILTLVTLCGRRNSNQFLTGVTLCCFRDSRGTYC
jgi:hypothetical protein